MKYQSKTFLGVKTGRHSATEKHAIIVKKFWEFIRLYDKLSKNLNSRKEKTNMPCGSKKKGKGRRGKR